MLSNRTDLWDTLKLFLESRSRRIELNWDHERIRRFDEHQSRQPYSRRTYNYYSPLARNVDGFSVRKYSTVGTCGICLDDIPAYNNAGLPCGHVTCFECVKQYLFHNIKDGKTDNSKLICPHPHCTQFYNSYHVFTIFGCDKENESFVKYVNFQVNRAFEMSALARYCSNSECNRLIIADPTRRRVQCPECSTSSCFRCRKRYHKFPFCFGDDSVDAFQADVKMKFYYLRNGAKRCPRCRFFIEKLDGCNHMTCVRCGHEFCWVCFKPYTPDHFNNPLYCSGRRNINFHIYGPMAPAKYIVDWLVDISIVIVSMIILPLLVPFFLRSAIE